MSEKQFFSLFKPAELGSTRLVIPNNEPGSRGAWTKMVDLVAPDEDACPLIVSIRSEYSVIQPAAAGLPVPVYPTGVDSSTFQGLETIGRPVVARVEWGIGGGYNVIEFDVPPSRTPANFSPANPNTQPINDIGNGVQICISASAVRVYARNDANIGFVASDPDDVTPLTDYPLPAKVLAFVGPGAVQSSLSPTRTIYVAGNGVELAGDADVDVDIPAFARAVRFPRTPAGTALTVETFDTVGTLTGTYDIASSDVGFIRLGANDASLTITNESEAAITQLNVLYDVSPI